LLQDVGKEEQPRLVGTENFADEHEAQ